MDDCSNTDNSMGAGVGDQLYDGRIHSHRAGDCRYCGGNWLYSEAMRVVEAGGSSLHDRSREKVVDLGPIQVAADKMKTLPPSMGAIAHRSMSQSVFYLQRRKMINILQKQPQVKILPIFSFDGGLRLRETDLNEVVRMVESVLPRYVNGDIDVTITLLEKNLKIVADMAVMRETLSHLIENAMDAVPGYGKFSLSVNQVNFEIESLLNGNDPTIGACALISLADTDISIDKKIKERIFEPFFTTRTDGNGLDLAIAYRIIKQHCGRIEAESRRGQGTEVNLYLPLTRSEIVSMMSIPLSTSCGNIH